MILALRLLSRPIIDEGKPKSHRAVLIKFPVLIAIERNPSRRPIMVTAATKRSVPVFQLLVFLFSLAREVELALRHPAG
jgi:hypothetical protein